MSLQTESMAEFMKYQCAFCKRPLDEWAVTQAHSQARRRKQLAPRPGDVCCLRKDCVKARKRNLKEGSTARDLVDEGQILAEHENPQDSHRESELFSDTQTRRDEEGGVKTETPRINRDFSTPAELAEREKKKARTQGEIFQDTLDSISLGPRCERHGIPDCGPCRLLAQSLENVTRVIPGVIKVPLEKPASTKINVDDLKREVLNIIRNRDPKATRDREGYKRTQRGSRRVNNKTKTRKFVNPTDNVPRLRLDNGYSVRQIATVFDDPSIRDARAPERDMSLLVTDAKFRKLWDQIRRGTRRSYPRTWGQLQNELPTKWANIFMPEDIALYRDYASGNVSVNELKQRIKDGAYGQSDFVKVALVQDEFGIADFDPVLMENKIISLAWQKKLLKPAKPGVRVDDKDRDLDELHDLEIKGIKTGAVDGGSVIERGQSKRTGLPLALDSFERGGQIFKTGPGENEDFDSARGTLEDGYGEEDAA